MKLLSVTIGCRLIEQGIFPRYKGSMLRGILGKSLRQAVCMTRKTDCTQCMLNNTCIFTRLFTASAGLEGGGTAPVLSPPYCLEPPLDEKSVYQADELFSFNLVLFSYATEYLPYFVHALTLAGNWGMGKVTESAQGRFVLEQVLVADQPVYDAEREWLTPIKPREVSPPVFGEFDPSTTKELRLNFLTPLRFKQNNHLSNELPFSQLMTLIVRRMKSLWALENEAFWLDNFDQCMELASRVVTLQNMLHWQDWSRYSGKQNVKMQLGGLTGSIAYRGVPEGFKDFIEFACTTHVGKQTSFGLGLMTATWGESS